MKPNEKMNKIKACTILILISLSVLSFGQQGARLEGYVFDKTTELPLENVQIMIKPPGKGTISNQNGFYTFTGLEPGNYFIEARYLGYAPLRVKISIQDIQTKTKDLYLNPAVQTLDEIEVRDKTFNRHSFPARKIEKMEIRQSAARDVGDFLRQEPNLSGIRKGAVGIDPVLRGNRFKQINVVVNSVMNIEGGCPNRMDPAISHIDIDDIREIEILKGPFALRYGPNFGGIINIKTINPWKENKFTTDVTAIKGYESNWNGSKEHLSVAGGNRRFFFSLSGNHKKYGNYTAGSGQEIRSAFEKYNYSVFLGAAPLENHQVILGMKRSYGRNISFPALPMDERSDDTRLLNFEYKIEKISGMIDQLNLKMYHSDVHHIMDNKERPFSDTVVAISDINAINYGGRFETALNVGNQKLFAGVDLERILKNGERLKHFIMQPNLPVKKEDLWKGAEIQNTGIFVSWGNNFGKWDLSFAGRLDFNNANSEPLMLQNMMGDVMYENTETQSQHTNISLSAGALWNMSKNWGIGFSLGRGVRSPDMTERFIILLPVGFDRYDYLGNPGLKPEANHEADLKIKYEKEKTGIFEGSIFFSYVTNFITGRRLPPAQVMPQTQDVLGVKQFYNEEHVYLYGFEFTYASPFYKGFALNINGAVTYGINPVAEKYIVENGEVIDQTSLKNDPLPEIPPFESNADLIWKTIKNKLDMKFSVRMVIAQNQISEAYDEETTPGFVLADFKVNYHFNRNLTVNAGVNNIFDKAYYEHLNRRIIGSMAPLYEPGRIFFVNLIFNI